MWMSKFTNLVIYQLKKERWKGFREKETNRMWKCWFTVSSAPHRFSNFLFCVSRTITSPSSCKSAADMWSRCKMSQTWDALVVDAFSNRCFILPLHIASCGLIVWVFAAQIFDILSFSLSLSLSLSALNSDSHFISESVMALWRSLLQFHIMSDAKLFRGKLR